MRSPHDPLRPASLVLQSAARLESPLEYRRLEPPRLTCHDHPPTRLAEAPGTLADRVAPTQLLTPSPTRSVLRPAWWTNCGRSPGGPTPPAFARISSTPSGES